MNKETPSAGAGSRFPPTRRSAILAARSVDPRERERALGTLIAAYWKPVFKYIRLRWNRGFEGAQDLAQGFFAQVLERDLLTKYDPERNFAAKRALCLVGRCDEVSVGRGAGTAAPRH